MFQKFQRAYRYTNRGRDRLTYRHGEASTFTLTTLRYGSAKRRKEIEKNERQNTGNVRMT